MFKSIRWRFITIYLLLIFLAMSIIGFYLTNQLEKIQLDSITQSMKGHISSILASSTALQSKDWANQAEDIREMVEKNVQIGYDENLYIIINTDDKRIIASSISSVVSLSAFESNRINNLLVLEALKGEIVETITSVSYDGVTEKIKHMAYPVKNNDGIIEGIIYLTYKLDAVYAIVEDTTFMLTRATILALFVTVILGFFLANSITGPIKDVTRKASEMSKGNFDQSVEVMSNDEIGQLAIMFNFLTQELKKNISKVYQEKSKMETTFNYMADGVITFNLDGSMIHANPVARKILDIDETLEIDGEKLLSGIDYQLSLMVLKEYHYTGRTMVNINDYIYNINYAPFRNEVDEIGGVIFVIQDITEQQKLENMRKEFVANVSHELKTPITTIKSYTETLLEGDIDSKETVQSFLKVINNESERMSRLVGDLLRLSRIEYNQTDWNKVIINPCEVLVEVLEKFSLVISEKNQTVAFESVDEHIDVLFDKDGLEQVFQNIISNAVKYTPEEGFIKINCYKNENNAIVCIKDNGIGISDEHRGRIFDRFYRVDQARSRDNGGTGLGLAIVKRILEAHHATIEVDSVVDEGTEFRIIIPTVHRGEEYA